MDKTARKGNAEALALRVVREIRMADEATPDDHPAKPWLAEALAVAEYAHREAQGISDLPKRANVDLLKRVGTLRHYSTVSR